MRRHEVVVAAALVVAASMAVPAARASAYAAEHTRAVAYWYLPTADDDVYRLYRAEVVSVRNLLTGAVSSQASIITDRCTEKPIAPNQTLFACGDGRRERTTRDAELEIAADMSSGTARIRLRGKTHVVHFEGPAEGGAYEMHDSCSETDHRVVAGTFTNMDRAHGRVLGKRLDRPVGSDLDHAWLMRGFGTWCDEDG